MKYENVTLKGNANEFRFSLTKEGNRKLVVFGVNPSTANEQIADLTITKVMGFAERNGFDGFIMLNLYPQRCTNPESLDKEIDEELQRKNLEAIRLSVGDMKEPIVLLGFGDTINLRPYLKRCLKEIIDMLAPNNPQWKNVGTLTKNGNPRHLSRVGYTSLSDFNMQEYISTYL